MPFQIDVKRGRLFRDAIKNLAADDQALHQRFRKPGFAHAFLHGGDIVVHAPEFDGLMLEIGDGKCRARIAVARLAHRARIQQIAARRFDAQRGEDSLMRG